MPTQLLTDLLARTFGFASFRANQEAVCRAAVEGRDVLLVMPTGAGKSLCYQLPALARGGAALVISPLIALMDDQAAKLESLGLRVARIHSGLSRDTAREACRCYLDGTLDFLFIAPERLRVPGFPEMLAKRKPGLVAIDEAHCISQWGHDFRPDYRMLGQHLQALRPSPVIALTATATSQVQDDIIAQLGLGNGAPAERFIHGFRRENLAVEVVQVPKPQRATFSLELLRDPGRRPAIVYAPTRKDAEMLAVELGRSYRAAAYHAGMDADLRERVQREFLAGTLEVVVATIAFGMGIDKANVRTVLHAALPSSLEGYYQEIGRAGRDGLPSRTILMHSFADRRQHDFFFERDYPPVERLDAIFRRLTSEPLHREELPELLRKRDRLNPGLVLEQEDCDKALEKLVTHGGALVDYQGFLTRGHDRWRAAYVAQSNHRGSQMDRVLRYAEAQECRMLGLIRHFGDTDDAWRSCGVCDVCAPESSIAQSSRGLDESERRLAHGVVAALAAGGRSTGKLHTDLCARNGISRDGFEDLLNAMAGAGFLRIDEASFEKDDRTISYRKASLTREGQSFSEADAATIIVRELILPDLALGSDTKPGQTRLRVDKGDRGAGRQNRRAAGAGRHTAEAGPLPPEAKALEERLRAWRKGTAARLGQPAFCVFSDKTMRMIALDRPVSEEDLLAVAGMGPAKVEKFGAEVCRLCAGS
ncbi:MAG TPA: ATP-dependent DNA helicase RecQ [Acidobacteriaceae bacterium]